MHGSCPLPNLPNGNTLRPQTYSGESLQLTEIRGDGISSAVVVSPLMVLIRIQFATCSSPAPSFIARPTKFSTGIVPHNHSFIVKHRHSQNVTHFHFFDYHITSWALSQDNFYHNKSSFHRKYFTNFIIRYLLSLNTLYQ